MIVDTGKEMLLVEWADNGPTEKSMFIMESICTMEAKASIVNARTAGTVDYASIVQMEDQTRLRAAFNRIERFFNVILKSDPILVYDQIMILSDHE